MKAHRLLIYFGMLALLLVTALIGGRIEDESQRLGFTTWVLTAMMVAVIAARYFFRRSNRIAAEPHETRRANVPAEEAVNIRAHPLNVRPVLFVIVIAGAFLIGAWLCLIYLGSVGGEDSQSTALMCLLMVSSAVTTIAAVLLSKLEMARQSRQGWVFQLAALSQVVLAFIGQLIMPLVALVIWNDYVDFRTYPLELGFVLMLLPMGAVIFSLTRGIGSDGRERQ